MWVSLWFQSGIHTKSFVLESSSSAAAQLSMINSLRCSSRQRELHWLLHVDRAQQSRGEDTLKWRRESPPRALGNKNQWFLRNIVEFDKCIPCQSRFRIRRDLKAAPISSRGSASSIIYSSLKPFEHPGSVIFSMQGYCCGAPRHSHPTKVRSYYFHGIH